MVGFNNVLNAAFLRKRISRNSIGNEIGIINNRKVSHIIIKINININKVIFNNKIIM